MKDKCKLKNRGDVKLEYKLGSQDVECSQISIVCACYKYTPVSEQRIFIIYTAAVSTTENITDKNVNSDTSYSAVKITRNNSKPETLYVLFLPTVLF